jgi:predicted nucleotidyltransferase
MDKFDEIRSIVIPVLKPYAKRVAVFGSFVRDEATIESDIDILVSLKPPDERPPLGLNWFGIEQDLGNKLEREVELISEDALSPYIRPYVEKEKVIIYEEG